MLFRKVKKKTTQNLTNQHKYFLYSQSSLLFSRGKMFSELPLVWNSGPVFSFSTDAPERMPSLLKFKLCRKPHSVLFSVSSSVFRTVSFHSLRLCKSPTETCCWGEPLLTSLRAGVCQHQCPEPKLIQYLKKTKQNKESQTLVSLYYTESRIYLYLYESNRKSYIT